MKLTQICKDTEKLFLLIFMYNVYEKLNKTINACL